MHGSRPPHPAARAFFEALDIKTKPKQTKIETTITTATNESGIDDDAAGNESSNRKNADDDDKNSQPTTAHTATDSSSASSSSAWIRKRIETLGWRNRYSQSDQYPLQMEVVNDNSDETFSFSVKQVQRGEVEGTYGTGATVWPASLVLLFYLQQKQKQQRQRQQSQVAKQNADNNSRCHDNNNNKTLTIVELGAGTGVVSIGAALLFGNHRSMSTIRIVCTDGCEAVVELARDNIRQAAKQLLSPLTSSSSQLSSLSTSLPLSSRNATNETRSSSEIVATIHGCPIQVKHYWWGTKPLPTDDDLTSSEKQKANSDSNNIHGSKEKRTIVLVSDCVLPKLYPIAPLVEALDQLLSQDGDFESDDDNENVSDVAYISYEHRYYPDYEPRDKFRELCQAKGLQVIPIPMEEQHSIYSVDDIELWKVQRAAALTK